MTQATDPSRNDADGTVTTPAAGTSRAIEAIKVSLTMHQSRQAFLNPGDTRCGRKRIDPVADFKRIPSMPCARESLLYGIGTGAGIGGIRYVSSRSE